MPAGAAVADVANRFEELEKASHLIQIDKLPA